MWAGKRHSPLTIQLVTMSISLLDKNFPGYPDPNNFHHHALGALCRTEHCSHFDSLLPKQTIESLWKSLLSGGGKGRCILMICLVGNETFQVPEKAKSYLYRASLILFIWTNLS